MPKRKRGDDRNAQKKTKTDNDEIADQPVSTRQRGAPKNTTLEASPGSDNGVHPFTVQSNGKDITCERRGRGKPALIFTHGAGGGISNEAMRNFADGFAEVSSIVSFQGTMNLPSRVKNFQAVIDHEDTKPALGGRSMGARAAVLAAQQSESGINALILASYPMVGAQKGDSREQILLDLPEGIDVLFISGSKDSMCDIPHLHKVIEKMKARSWVVEVQGADHGMSLKPKAAVELLRREQGLIAARWLLGRDEEKRYCELSWSAGDGKVVSCGWKSKPGGSGDGSSSIKNWAKPVK